VASACETPQQQQRQQQQQEEEEEEEEEEGRTRQLLCASMDLQDVHDLVEPGTRWFV
jgi:hypothetical protein